MNGLARVTRRAYQLDRYITREAFAVCMMTLAVLTAISLLLFLAELLGDLADGEVLVSTLVELLLLRLPEAVLLVAPLALVIGLLMSLGELAEGEEFSVMRSAGLKPGRMLKVVMALALAWSVGLLLVSGWIAPWAEQRSAAIAERMADDLLLASIQPGQFQALAGGRLTVYVRSADLDSGRLHGLFVHFFRDDQVEVIAAASGRLYRLADSGKRVLSLRDGVHLGHRNGAGGLPMRRIEFERNDIQLPITAGRSPEEPARRSVLPNLLSDGSAAAGLELRRRLVPSIISIVLAFFALPVTLTGRRGKRFGVVVAAIVIYLAYSNTANLMLARGAADAVGWPGIWLLHALALALAMVPLAIWWRRW